MKSDSIKQMSVVRADGVPGVIKYGLRYIEGNRDAYFTVTAWFANDSGGCCHDEILKLAPQLAPLIDLHLSDEETGQPMHLYANAAYWAGMGRYSEKSIPNLAKHLRVPVKVAEELINFGSQAELKMFIDSQLDRYKQEAQAAIKAFGLREGGQS